MSDGSASLRFLDPKTLHETGRVTVRDGDVAITDLNELEQIRGEIFANVWHTDRIARIAPESGRVTGWIDLRGLLPAVYQLEPEAVLNGIAYDELTIRYSSLENCGQSCLRFALNVDADAAAIFHES